MWQLSRQLADAAVEINSALRPALRDWYESGAVWSLDKAVSKAMSFGICVAPTEYDESVSFQKELASQLQVHLSAPSFPAFLRTRLSRWLPADCTQAETDAFTNNALLALAHLKGCVPPAVVVSLLKTWLNGWCTSRRFGDEPAGCKLMACSQGEDDIEHFLYLPTC